MDNIASTISSQTSPHMGNPLNPLPIPPLASEPATTTTIESLVSSPLDPVLSTVEPVGHSMADGSVQAHMDVNYQPHDVALASVTKTSDRQSNPVLKSTEHNKMEKLDMHDDDEHPEKSHSPCSMLNKLFLALAIICFALFLGAIAYIVSNFQGLNGKANGIGWTKPNYLDLNGDDFSSSDQPITGPYFNLTNPDKDGIIVVLSRRGASVDDILIPYVDNNGSKQYRSIVIKGGNEKHFGSVRFGFDDPMNPLTMTYELPLDYRYLNYYNEDWLMIGDIKKPSRVRFTKGSVQIIYEISLNKDFDEFIMTSMVATPSDQPVFADPTNNIYFNLRGHGDLSTHNLSLSVSSPFDIKTGQKMEQDQLIQPQRVDQLPNVNKYFYKFERAGVGKNYIAKLFESETKTTMHVFSDNTGVVIDPNGVGLADEDVNHATAIPSTRGVRISPKQSPTYKSEPIYGPFRIVYPSQAIHTTWWRFDYKK